MSTFSIKNYSVVFGIAGILTLSCLAFSAKRVYADSSATTVSLPVLSQHLAIPDRNGDTGYYDCTIAAVTIALQGIASGTIVSLPHERISYETVRLTSRAYYPDVLQGITFREAVMLIPRLSENTLQANFVKIDHNEWAEMLTRNLKAGYPVVVHISDWRYLPGHSTHRQSAHAVTVSGIGADTVSYVDPWDGREYSVSREQFAAAWSTGHYSWHALLFQKSGRASDFTEIQRLRGFQGNT